MDRNTFLKRRQREFAEDVARRDEFLLSKGIVLPTHHRQQSPNLASMWKHAEKLEGRTLVAAIKLMNEATGRHYTYKRAWEWIRGRAPVPTAARGYMLRRALPIILKCVAVRLKPRELAELEEMLT